MQQHNPAKHNLRMLITQYRPHTILTDRPSKYNDVSKCKSKLSDSIPHNRVYSVELLVGKWETLEMGSGNL